MPEFSDEAHDAKREMRIALLAARRSLSAADRAVAAAAVQAELVTLVRRLRPARMSAYVPVASEPGGDDLPDVLRAALPPDAELLLPVLRGDLDLDWAPYTGPESLRAAGRGLREPTAPPRGVPRWPEPPWSWCRRSRWTAAASGWAGAAARTTARWPGCPPQCRQWRCCTTASWSRRCPPCRTTARCTV